MVNQIKMKNSYEIVAVVVLVVLIAGIMFKTGAFLAKNDYSLDRLTGAAVGALSEPQCPFIYKITDSGGKPTIRSSCNKYQTVSETTSQRVCADKSWWTGRCVEWKTVTHPFTRQVCVEDKVTCSITVKNYENKVGTFGFKAYFETQNGKIEKPVVWRDIYPQETERFVWNYVASANERGIVCGMVPDYIPEKKCD